MSIIHFNIAKPLLCLTVVFALSTTSTFAAPKDILGVFTGIAVGTVIGAAIANQNQTGNRTVNQQQRNTTSAPPRQAPVVSLRLKEIQSSLNTLGYDAGPVDGLIGSRTRGAISLFQSDSGYQVTSILSDNQLLALREHVDSLEDINPELVYQSETRTNTVSISPIMPSPSEFSQVFLAGFTN